MSPDERHNLVMVRLSRSRRKDPVNRRAAREWHGPTHGGLWEPSLAHAPEISGDGATGHRREQAGQNAPGTEGAQDDDDVNMAVSLA
eukprot:6113688-Pyramimonas_sp.AAC.1